MTFTDITQMERTAIESVEESPSPAIITQNSCVTIKKSRWDKAGKSVFSVLDELDNEKQG